MSVYDILFPADEQFKGMVHLAVLNQHKELKSLGYCFADVLPERIDGLEISHSRDYYITANTTKRFTKRCKENLFALNNIVLDFDIHTRMNQHTRDELIDEFIWRMKRDLFNIGTPFNIPLPNVIHRTGRGCQVWFHLSSVSGKLLFLYQQAIDLLGLIFTDFIKEYPELEKNVELDLTASKNAVGLFRLFDTYNTHTKRRTETEILHGDGIDLNTLCKSLENHPIIAEIKCRAKEKQAEYKKRRESSKKGRETVRRNNSYTALHKKRVAFIEWWSQRLPDTVGKRDKMLYLAYNSCLWYMSEPEARRLCGRINASFIEPLTSIDYIFKEIKKPFKMTNQAFFDMLGPTEQEKNQFEISYSKISVNLTRNAERKARKEQRERDKRMAEKLLGDGLSHKQVAEKTSLSPSTVARISASLGRHSKSETKAWEKLGISRATYYRKLKNESAPI